LELNGVGQQTKGGRAIQFVEPSEYDEGFVSPVGRVLPAGANRRIEKIAHQTISIETDAKFTLQKTGSLKFCKALQLVLREAVKEFKNYTATC
jgi:hypothetical protein